MRSSTFLVLLVVVSWALSSPLVPESSGKTLSSISEHRVVFSAPRLSSGWSVEEVALDGRIRPTLSVHKQGRELLERLARAVSDPKSTEYGHYLTKDEVNQISHPREEDLHTVSSWLDENHVSYTVDRAQGLFVLDLSITEACLLFHTTFSKLVHTDGRKTIRAGDYSIPANVRPVISSIHRMHGLPLPPHLPLVRAAFGEVLVTPKVINETYNVTGVTPSRGEHNRQAVAEFQGEFMSPQDLKTFFKKYVHTFQKGDDEVFKFVHDQGTGDGLEAQLDIQYIMGVAPGVKTEFWEWQNDDFCADLKNWTATMLADDDLPTVHSISYGWQGDLQEIGCEEDEVNDVDQDFAQLAARGISVIFASGDSGSGYDPYSKKTNDDIVLYPSWPASSPWVTAVGSTRFINQKETDGEMATDEFGSGGGFSTQFDQPSWQKDAVDHFFATAPASGIPPSGFPKNGRATPDVAALGQAFQVVSDGGIESVGGTSASAPLFAGLIALINDARLAAGKPQLGFLNPFLYQNADAFNDVVTGNNRIGRGGEALDYGWDAVEGWDPATGLGTPNFYRLLKAALK